jgi:CBS domain containing-hemolysin-like protein
MNDAFGALLALALIGVNAFFVGAEFSLISARRDRLEALAEQGRARAVTVIRAGEQLPSMLAGSQLGVTVASLLLGRIGEAAVADVNGQFIGYLHIKDVLTLVDDPQTVIDPAVVRSLPRVPASLPLADALSRMRRSNSHLALVTGEAGTVVAMVAMEDLVEDLVGTMREAG